MKINLLVRFKNPVFIIQLSCAIIMPILTYFGLNGSDITTWGLLFDTFVNAIKNPYVLFTVAVSIWGVINDPTTKGMSDSEQALTYKQPK